MSTATIVSSDVIKNTVLLNWKLIPARHTSQVVIRESGASVWTNASPILSYIDSYRSYEVTNLTPGTTYEWAILCSYKGVGEYSSIATLVIPPALATPTNLSAVSAGSSATISWDAVTNADYYIVSFKKSTDANYTSFTTGKTSIVLTGLDDSATYNWKVTALDKEQGYCDSESSVATFAYVSAVPLSAPTGLAVGNIKATDAVASWTAVANASSYQITYAPSGGSATTVTSATNGITLTGLSESTSYTVSVIAVGDGTNYTDSTATSTTFTTSSYSQVGGAQFITFAEFKTKLGIPANTPLSQIIPSSLGISNIDSYWTPIIIESIVPPSNNVSSDGSTLSWRGNEFIVTQGSVTTVIGSGWDSGIEIAFPHPIEYHYDDEFNGFGSGYAIIATTATGSLPTNYGLGFANFNGEFYLWDVTENYISTWVELSYSGTRNNYVIGAHSYMFFLIHPGNYTPPSSITSAEPYILSVHANYDAYAPLIEGVADSATPDPILPPTQPLSAPTGLTHDQVTSSSARVGWNAVTNAEDYKVEYRQYGQTNWIEHQQS